MKEYHGESFTSMFHSGFKHLKIPANILLQISALQRIDTKMRESETNSVRILPAVGARDLHG